MRRNVGAKRNNVPPAQGNNGWSDVWTLEELVELLETKGLSGMQNYKNFICNGEETGLVYICGWVNPEQPAMSSGCRKRGVNAPDSGTIHAFMAKAPLRSFCCL